MGKGTHQNLSCVVDFFSITFGDDVLLLLLVIFFDNSYPLSNDSFKVSSKTKQKYLEVRGTSDFRKMYTKDIPKVTKILQNHFKQFKIAPVIDKEWVKHWILPANSYINEIDNTFISFYDIPNHRKDGLYTIKQAYSFYIVGDVFNDAFLIAKNLGYDLFTTLDIGKDVPNLEKQKFLKGDGNVHYYLFNWLPSSSISLEDVEVKLP